MNKNIEINQINTGLSIEKYGKENIDFIEKNPEIEKITNLFNLKENSESFPTMKNILDKIIVIDKSTKKLKKLKNKLA